MKYFEAHRCKVRHIPYYVTDQCRGRLSTPLADADSDHSSDNGGEVRRPVYTVSSAQPKPSTGQTKLSPTPTVRWIEGTPSSRRLPTIPNICSAMALRRKGAEKGEIHLILWRLHIGSVLIQIGSSIEDICGVGLHRFRNCPCLVK
ncbi:hypothetical protein R3P38DRAFT_2787489 [Favolaschia claudopus]|uniref:Uncharacterized protein n=1 Tax=Favolaschia claudopus TaxID=2862362 RepID=A0AAW0AQJ3_9AGAR